MRAGRYGIIDSDGWGRHVDAVSEDQLSEDGLLNIEDFCKQVWRRTSVDPVAERRNFCNGLILWRILELLDRKFCLCEYGARVKHIAETLLQKPSLDE